MSYREQICKYLNSVVPLQDRVILEIGSDHTLETARILNGFGARLVIASNFRDAWTSEVPGRGIVLYQIDARSLSTKIGAGSVDCVVGTAVLEHVHDLPRMLAEIKGVLNPGGFVCLHGGPIWSSGQGHHIWVDVPGAEYRFNDQARNPIQHWEHLMYNRTEMGLRLRDRVPDGHVEPILQWIYNSSAINRLSRSDMLEAVDASGMHVVAQHDNAWIGAPDPATTLLLDQRNARCERYDISETILILQRADDC